VWRVGLGAPAFGADDVEVAMDSGSADNDINVFNVFMVLSGAGLCLFPLPRAPRRCSRSGKSFHSFKPEWS